jgi:hypothetical protein
MGLQRRVDSWPRTRRARVVVGWVRGIGEEPVTCTARHSASSVDCEVVFYVILTSPGDSLRVPSAASWLSGRQASKYTQRWIEDVLLLRQLAVTSYARAGDMLPALAWVETQL